MMGQITAAPLRRQLWALSRTCLSRGARQICTISARLFFLSPTTPAAALSSFFNHQRRALQSLSQRQQADLEETLVSKVSQQVKDPILQRDLKSLGWLNASRSVAFLADGESVQLLLKLPSLLHPDLDRLKEQVTDAASSVLRQWNEHASSKLCRVQVEAIATSPTPFMSRLVEEPDELLKELGPGLESVSHVVAVYSCKGGVGKSTVAVNLAYELARQGGRVGLLDLDLYGPSLPILVQPKDKTVRRSSKKGTGMVYPIEHEGIRMLSLGFVNTNSGVQGSGSDNGAAILRGPLVVKVVAQLLKGTDWGELDVLLLDLPPGTGDVQLAVCQDLALSGAVAVSTPSKLATEDTQKGIEMFTSLGVPTLAVVENMSYFVCEGGKKHYPFGRGSTTTNDSESSAAANDTPSIQFPISSDSNDAAELGQPLCLSRPITASEELGLFEQLAKIVSKELLRTHYGDNESRDAIIFPQDPDSNDGEFSMASINLTLDHTIAPPNFTLRVFSSAGAIQKRIHPAELRARDPKDGTIIEDSPFRGQLKQAQNQSKRQPTSPIVTQHNPRETSQTGKPSPSLTPVKVDRKGRYGFAVQWADGATVIYSKACLGIAAGGTVGTV